MLTPSALPLTYTFKLARTWYTKTSSREPFAKKTFEKFSFNFCFQDYFGITSRANLLATTSRNSVRFLPASIIASREP